MSAEAPKKKRVGILISGRGSNMMSLVEAACAPSYPAEIVCVISNRPEAAGLSWAKSQGIAVDAIDHKAFETRPAFEDALHERLIAHNVELVVLAGFMRVLTEGFVDRWRDLMLNIHPSLLPSFKGLHTHARALAAGVKIAGCTVHVVRAEMDAGPIVAQAAVPVLPDDTEQSLSERILKVEHRIFPLALEMFVSGRAQVSGDTVKHSSSVNQSDFLCSPSR